MRLVSRCCRGGTHLESVSECALTWPSSNLCGWFCCCFDVLTGGQHNDTGKSRSAYRWSPASYV